MISYAKSKGYHLPIHLCTAKLKDAIQFRNRIKREALHTHRAFDEMDDEGMLTRGAIYVPELSPGFEYNKRLAAADKDALHKKLLDVMASITASLHLAVPDIALDEQKMRILLSHKHVKRWASPCKKQGLIPAIVVEYPTADQFEVDIEYL
ncbi:hypothetical protein HZB02_02300 [Candidatus Woesearchaeota archaeon]|nr:hypothetical protein [Candidatus Woesearchaeota archaeon]